MRSVLFTDAAEEARESREAPRFFHDLGLARVVEAITAGREEYDLVPFFHAHLTDVDAIVYRQDVMREMESAALRQAVSVFAERMRSVRQRLTLAQKRSYELEKQAWILGAAEIYLEAVERLAGDLGALPLASRAFCAFRDDLQELARSDAFRGLAAETRGLLGSLGEVRYTLLIRDGHVTVRRYEGEGDHTAAVEETFAKFRESAARDFRCRFPEEPGLNHVEAAVLDRVALLFPVPFASLARFSEAHADLVDPGVARFDREVQFYAAYRGWMERLGSAGLPFCIPEVSSTDKHVFARETFDPALAERLVREKGAVVTNDFALEGNERVFVVTGPNQGGKTTFARTFGQLHYLAALGASCRGGRRAFSSSTASSRISSARKTSRTCGGSWRTTSCGSAQSSTRRRRRAS